MHELSGERIVLRPLEPAVAVELAELGADPEVARWWPNMTPEDLLGEDDRTLAFTIELDGRPIGVAQAWEENEPDYRHAGIDLFIGAPWQGQGLGTDAVRTIARHLVRERGHHRLTIDPALENERAIRCYERVGFKRVGVLRRYERAGDGPGATPPPRAPRRGARLAPRARSRRPARAHARRRARRWRRPRRRSPGS